VTYTPGDTPDGPWLPKPSFCRFQLLLEQTSRHELFHLPQCHPGKILVIFIDNITDSSVPLESMPSQRT
jgi:hypothetical protein